MLLDMLRRYLRPECESATTFRNLETETIDLEGVVYVAEIQP